MARINVARAFRVLIPHGWCLFGVLLWCAGCGPSRTEVKPSEAPAPVVLEKQIPVLQVGERMKFSIRWLGIEAGTAEVSVKEIVKIKGRDAYHIEAKVRSNKIIDLIYPVRDEHHSYIDVEHFHSLRYEKKVKERYYRADEVMEYDQENHEGRYESKRSGTVKEMIIPKNVQDQVSCAFWFRFQEMNVGDKVMIPINVDEKNWKLEVEVHALEELEIDGFGKMMAIRSEPFARFQSLFARRGRAWGWVSADKRRIPLLMRAKVPALGSIYMVITEYESGDDHVKA